MSEHINQRFQSLELAGNGSNAPGLERIYVAIDLETTGLDSARDRIIEIGATRFQGDRILDRFVTLVDPQRPIPLRITQITGICTADVAGAPTIDRILPELLAFVSGDVAAIIAHNAGFDIGFLRTAGVDFRRPVYDTLELSSILLPGLGSYSLGELCLELGIELVDAHRALDDAQATAELFWRLSRQARALPASVNTLILASAQDEGWVYRQFFADAAAQPLPPATRVRTQTALPQRPLTPTALDNGGETTTPIAEEALLQFFAAGGPLDGLMGDTFERRPGQVAMAAQVLQAFNTGDYLLIEAGTGTGKSLAYLLPAALWAVANQRRVVIATNTIALQDQLMNKDIPQVQSLLAAAGYPIAQAALLKGRQNYLCTRRLHAWRTSHRLTPPELTVLAKVLVWLSGTRSGDAGEIALFSPLERAIWSRICSDGATCSPDRCGMLHTPEPAPELNAQEATLPPEIAAQHTNPPPELKAREATLPPEIAVRHTDPPPELGGRGGRDFYLEARRRAEFAHLLVVNHALLLADLVAEGRVLPPYAHLVVDETHRLEEAATDQLTYRVEWSAVQLLLRRVSPEGDLATQVQRAASSQRLAGALEQLPGLASRAQRATQALAEFAAKLATFARHQSEVRSEGGYAQRLALNGAVRSQPDWSQLEVEWDEARGRLQRLLESSEGLVRVLDSAQWWASEPLAALFAEFRDEHMALTELARQLDDILLAPAGNRRDRVAWMEVADNTSAVTLAIAPLAVHDLLERELVQRRRCAIFTGATLRTGPSFQFIRERLGLWDVKIATVDSPFDYKRSALLYLPSDMQPPNHPHYQQMVEQAIVEAAGAANGRTLVLFTSYQQLRAAGDAIRGPLERQGVAVFQHGQSSRQRLLREYRQAEQAVLLGTRSFWEGIDLPGDELSCLLITRLPFAVPNDPLFAARSAEFEDPFHEYTVPDAVLRFRQGFGRLIRRASDRGVVVLLDSRAWRKDYGQAFLDALPECTVRRAPLQNLGREVRTWLARSNPGKA